jgi:hypothetical protein
MSMSGPITRTRLEPVGDLHRAGRLGEALCERVIDAVLHQDAVGADAGLAGIAIFRGDRPLDRCLDIGVVEDDERRVAAQLERQFLDRAGALPRVRIPLPPAARPPENPEAAVKKSRLSHSLRRN